MLDGAVIVDAVVSAFQSIPALLAEMDEDPTRIGSFHFLYGVDVPLRVAIAQMLSPSMLVWWESSGPGRLNGMTTWQHTLGGAFRIGNVAGEDDPAGPSTVFQIMMNSPVNGGSVCIRKVRLLPTLYLMDTPTVQQRVDEQGLDYFQFRMVFPEDGDF
jgi:hypothetical protein